MSFVLLNPAKSHLCNTQKKDYNYENVFMHLVWQVKQVFFYFQDRLDLKCIKNVVLFCKDVWDVGCKKMKDFLPRKLNREENR